MEHSLAPTFCVPVLVLLGGVATVAGQEHPFRAFERAGAHAKAGRWDAAVLELDGMLAAGYAATAVITKAAEQLFPAEREREPRWTAFFARCGAREEAIEKALDPEAAGVSERPLVAQLDAMADDPRLGVAGLHRRSTGALDFPDPKGRDLWLRFFDRVDEKLPLPFYVHVPRSTASRTRSTTSRENAGGSRSFPPATPRSRGTRSRVPSTSRASSLG